MSDLSMIASPPRAELLRHLSSRLGELIPGARLLAERVLGAESRIDLVALEPNGRISLMLVGSDGQDLELVGRGLAHRAWVQARVRDWLQLAPHLGVKPEAGVKVWVICPSIRPEAVAAAAELGPDAFGMAVYHCVGNAASMQILFETLGGAPVPFEAAPAPATGDGVQVPAFRTGLTDADLGLTSEESGEFE